MDAERLVALEAALAELGGLYTTARNFAPLEPRAENELLPQLTALAARLRVLHRTDRMSQADIDAASREILDLRASWQSALQGVREMPTYRAAVDAHGRDDQAALARLIPRIFAGIQVVEPATQLYFGISAAIRRRGPGTSPFLSAEACADKIASTVREGLAPRPEGGDWWDTDLPSLSCVDTATALDTPFGVRLDGRALRATLFGSDNDLGYRLYTPRLTGAFGVVIAHEAEDEWWQAFEQPYREFRQDLGMRLTARGVEFELNEE